MNLSIDTRNWSTKEKATVFGVAVAMGALLLFMVLGVVVLAFLIGHVGR